MRRSAVGRVARAGWALIALVATACDRGLTERASPAEQAAVDAGAIAPSPAVSAGPLVVAIVVDQLAAWVASERLSLLPASGGFARLLREGTYGRDMRYAHAATDTAPGHASLYTGVVPRASGVFANEVVDPVAHGNRPIVLDETTQLLFADVKAFTGSSLRVLKASPVADAFREAHRDAVILSLSLKDRGALFAGGHKPTAALWYDRSLDRFVTSTAVASAYPRWAESLSRPTSVASATWNPLDADWLRAQAKTPDNQEGEGNIDGKGVTFPHDVVHSTAPPKAFVASPFGDDVLFALALAGLDEHRGDPGPRFLALSLSANDYVGHVFGPDSWEAWDELRRLDASLGRFFAALDERFGAERWSAVLTGDHGVATLPEAANGVPAARPWCQPGAAPDRWQRPCATAGRLFAARLSFELGAVAEATLHRRGLVDGVADPYVVLSKDARQAPAADRKHLISALSAALRKHPEVDRVIDTSTLPQACPPESDESVDALVCRSFVVGSAGDLYVVVKPGSFFDPNVVEGKGTSHGSPWLFDRSVPLLVRARRRGAAMHPARTIEDPISFHVFTRTLSTLLGVEPTDPQTASALDLAAASAQ